MSSGAIDFFRRADWLDEERVRGYAVILLVVSLVSLIWPWWQATHGVGSDFLAFWGAARLTLNQGAAAAYGIAAQTAVQATTGFAKVFAFVNPPPFLFFVIPFGLLPFGVAWIAWVAATGAAWFAAATRILPGSWRRWWMLIAAFPGALIAASHAQNGLLTGALLIAGVALVDRRPRLAGAFIGALVIKPHLALLMPFWLAAGRRWTAFVAAGCSALGLLALAWLVFGTHTMLAYTTSWQVSAQIMDNTKADFYLRMATVYSQVRIYFGPQAGLAANAAVALAMVILVWASWRRFGGDANATGALALAATPLASPYLFNYDLAFLVLPMLWLLRESRRAGYRDWDRLILLILYLSPHVTRAFSLELRVNLMPLAALVMVALIWRRAALPQRHNHVGTVMPPALSGEARGV